MEAYCSLEYQLYLSIAMTGQPDSVRHGNMAFGAALREACKKHSLRVFDPEELELHYGPFDGDSAKEAALFAAFDQAIQQSELMVVLIDGPSTGVGVETAFAYRYRKPIIVVSRDFNALSLMLKQNPQIVHRITFQGVEQTVQDLMPLVIHRYQGQNGTVVVK